MVNRTTSNYGDRINFMGKRVTSLVISDLALEYDEGEVYQHFKEFYNDVLPEFQAIGKVVQFKVSCNFEPHLRGNVYVQYSRFVDRNVYSKKILQDFL